MAATYSNAALTLYQDMGPYKSTGEQALSSQLSEKSSASKELVFYY